jgi:GR25 family glycosyltransferase involved in LPS biosynthesis
MKSLYYTYDLEVEHAYIMRIKGNEQSERYAERCAQSCEKAGQKYIIWDAFDGTINGEEIQFPDHAKYESLYKILKLSSHYITKAEVACTLTHLSVWLECAKIG